MTQSQTAEPATAPAKSLPARFAGVLFSPRATYADVAARPRWLGIFLLVFLVSGTAAAALMSTEIGRNAVIDRQIESSKAFGREPTQAQIDQFEKMAPYLAYITPVFQIVGLGLGCLAIAGVAFAVFNAFMGGDATFKQNFAIVAHSGVILAVLSLFTTPLAYARETLSSATNLGVFLPFLDESSFAARLLGSIDLVFIWWILSLSIGLGVLHRKRTGPIATTMFAIYVAIALVIAAIKTASTGA
jgi:hypothetical protein